MNSVLDNTIITEGPDHRGRVYTGSYFVKESGSDGPGWYVYQHSDERDVLYRLAARPDVKARRFKLWNGSFRRGWWRKRDALAVAKALATR